MKRGIGRRLRYHMRGLGKHRRDFGSRKSTNVRRSTGRHSRMLHGLRRQLLLQQLKHRRES